MHTRDAKSLFTNIQKKQYNMLKIKKFLRNLQTSRANNSIIPRIRNAKFSGYCFSMSTDSEIFESALAYL